MDLDYSTGIQSAYIDGVLIGSGAMANAATDLGHVQIGRNFGSEVGATATFDNLDVSSVPEPATRMSPS